LGLNLGFLPAGRGESTDEVGDQQDTNDYDDESGLALGGYAMFSVSEFLSFGPALNVVPNVEVDPDQGSNQDYGTELDVQARVDYAIPIGASPAAGHLVGGAGLVVLFPGGDFEDDLKSIGADTNPRLGLSGSVGGGLTYDLTFARLRGDLMLELYSLRLVNEQVSVPFVGEQDLKRRATGSRVWALVGLEF